MTRIWTALTVAAAALGIATSNPSFAKPNLMIILADDMGYGDLESLGSKHLRTPHLDQLLNSGVFCPQGYVASPVCSPSRAGLLTGRDPRRFGYEGNLNMSPSNYATRPELLGLPLGEHTLGDHLRNAGYATALIGKWHLGTGSGFHPNERGFDYFCGMLQGGHDYFPTRIKNPTIERNQAAVTEFSKEYLTDFFTDEGLRWIDEKKDQPWFLFMSYNAPHTPMQATESDLARFAHIQDKKRRTYAAMMFALDRGVGRIVDHLEQTGQRENTLIVFFSDNGGASNNGSWNGPLSSTKGTLREGGVRVPMFWSWPGTLPASSRYAGPVSAVDVLPTFLAASGSKPLPLAEPRSHEDKRNRQRAVNRFGAYDGMDLLPLLSGKEPVAKRTLFWRLQGQTAILDGEDKLIRLSHRPAQWFRPAEDAGEAKDLSDKSDSRFIELFTELGRWEATLPTVPLWGSSPFWNAESARLYDNRPVAPEPE